MKALRKLYTANLDNEVVAFATNLKDFVREVQELEPEYDVRNYDYYFREFKKGNIVKLIIDDEKTYNLQEVFNGD